MTTKTDNHNLNLLLTVVIAVLILFLVFKDKINLGAFYSSDDNVSSETPYIHPAAIRENLEKLNSMETQLELEKVEQLEKDFLSSKTVANLRQEAARMASELDRLATEKHLAAETLQQEKLLTEQLMMQLESERSNAQSLIEARDQAERTIESLNAEMESIQKDSLSMRRDKEQYSLDNHALETELQLKKKEIVRARLELDRMKTELARKDNVIASKNMELNRKRSEITRIQQLSSATPSG